MFLRNLDNKWLNFNLSIALLTFYKETEYNMWGLVLNLVFLWLNIVIECSILTKINNYNNESNQEIHPVLQL